MVISLTPVATRSDLRYPPRSSAKDRHFSLACSRSKTLPARAQQQLSWRHFSLCSTRWQHLRHRQLNQLLPTAIVWTTLRTPLQFHCTRPDRVCTPSTRRGIPVTSTTMVFISSSRHHLRSVEDSLSQWVIEIVAAPLSSLLRPSTLRGSRE